MSYSKYLRYQEKEVVLLILEGNFYSCYSEDAYVIHELLLFKIQYFNKVAKASFPKTSLEKVHKYLEYYHISFTVVNDNKKSYYFPDNQYTTYLKRDTYLKDKLLEQLSSLSYFELLSITQVSFKR